MDIENKSTKKKIGILSMQRIKNYGSFLQAYGLRKLIEEQGYEVQYVDYHVEEPIIKDNLNGKNDKISKALKTLEGDAPLIQKIQYIIHKKNFGKKYYGVLGLTETPNYNPELDTLVIGSDEVFNCIQSNKNVGYSLELFGKDNNAKKVITYAASFGNTTIAKLEEHNKKEEIADLLNKMDMVSARDNNTGKIVETISDKKVVYNLDPVLAYDYMNKCNEIPDIDVKEKFIIVYAYSNRISANESKYIREFAKKNNLKVYSIGGAQKCADKFIDCSPFEALAYFKKAEIVITDTFHGSIFSIITKRNFVTLVRKSVGNAYGNEEKLTDLLERLSLKDRITYDIKNIDEILNNKIDYDKVDEILKSERANTFNYLKNEL
ncbi:MAG: polysaccharide pyruvyl transferase family protein [Clostridia bacterium]|nr:polysaccharide pyruvyl transferase family protein [Clostridia bacterium]